MGLFARLVRHLLRPARVSRTANLSRNIRLISLEGDALKGCSWIPGDKVQLRLGPGFSTRTYTPMGWDHVAGSTQVLAYDHGDGIGAHWARTTASGDELHLIGPRSSLAFANWMAPIVLFGDETSFGLAAALKAHASAGSASSRIVLEVDDKAGSEAILSHLELKEAVLVARHRGSAHLGSVVEALLETSRDATFVLTGGAPSIQHVIKALRSEGIPSSHLRARAFWAPGKIGLD